jgi:hypothetical protein
MQEVLIDCGELVLQYTVKELDGFGVTFHNCLPPGLAFMGLCWLPPDGRQLE